MTYFGLRFFDGGHEVKLMQVAGDGRVRLRSNFREWWGRPMIVDWHAYVTQEGERWRSLEEAERVASNLLKDARNHHLY